MIKKGLIATINGNKVTVVMGNNAVSCALIVPFYLIDCLTVGMPVVFVEFEDCTGIVLSRMDGEWNYNISGNVNINGNIKANGDLNVSGNIKASDIVTSVAAFNSHIHTGVHGETTTPH